MSLWVLVYQLRLSPSEGIVGSDRLASWMPSQVGLRWSPLANPKPFSQVNTAYVPVPSVKTSTPKAPRSSVKLLPDVWSCMDEASVGFVAVLTFSTVKPVSLALLPPLPEPVATTYGTLFTTNDFTCFVFFMYVLASSTNSPRYAGLSGSVTSMMTIVSLPTVATAAYVFEPILNVSTPNGLLNLETSLCVRLPFTTGCTGSVMSTTDTPRSPGLPPFDVTSAYVLSLSV